MTEKKEINEIKESIRDLAKRCHELDVNLAVSFSSDNNNEIGSSIVGDPLEVFLLIQHLTGNLSKQTKMTTLDLAKAFLTKEKGCGCPNCKAKRAAENERENNPASMEEIKSMLINILGGMQS